MRAFFVLPCFFFGSLFSQPAFRVSFDELYPIPGKAVPATRSDLSGNVVLEVRSDSLFFTVEVSDDEVLPAGKAGEGDRVEVWFGNPWLDFSDFISAEWKDKYYLFRNTLEPGDQADLQRFLKDGDYPKGKLVNPETSAPIDVRVPPVQVLKRSHEFAGLTRLVFHADGSGIQHLDREKYHGFEVQTGLQVVDLAQSAKYTSEKIPGGYRLHIRMHNRCIGFARPEMMNQLRVAVDIVDKDTGVAQEIAISTSKNRFYGRSWYFNKIELPFNLEIPLAGIPGQLIKTLNIQLDVVATKKGWMSYGFYAGPLVYGHDVLSETGLMELSFHAIHLHFEAFENPAWQRLDVSYNDATVFDQHEVYVVLEGRIYSGKKYRYTKLMEEDFFYRVFPQVDGSFLLPIYDYEVVDPLGFGELGHTADEFVSIQRIQGDTEKSIFALGQRIEAAQAITIGEKDPITLHGVGVPVYSWIEPGKEFKIQVKGAKAMRFRLNEQGIFQILP